MKNKKTIAIIIFMICVLIIIMKTINHSPDVLIEINSVEEDTEAEVIDWSYEGSVLKVMLSVTNKTKKPIMYLNSELIEISGEAIESESVISNSSESMLETYETIKPNETIKGCVYFKASNEDKIKLKTKILYNVTSDGSNINGDTEEYITEIKK